MKNKLKLIALTPVAAVVMAMTSQSHAAGTTAGTQINNKATLNFSVGGVPQPVIESSPAGNLTPGVAQGADTSFLVDRRLNLTVATTNTAPVAVGLGNPNMVTSFSVTNSTNDTIDVILSNVAGMPAGSLGATGADDADFINGVCTMHATAADAAANTSAITRLDNVAADASSPVFVRCDIQPLTALAPQTFAAWNNRVNVVSLVGQAAVAGGGAAYVQDTGADVAGVVQNVFGDEAGGSSSVGGPGTTNNGAGAGTDDYRDGKHSANSAYVINMPILSVLKTEQLVCDPLNGTANPKRIPGALVRYTITVANDSAALASGILTTVTDPLQAELLHDVNFVAGTDAATCVAGAAATSGGAAGNGFRQTTAGSPRPAGPTYFTNAVDADGAGISGQSVTSNYANGLPVLSTTHLAGELKPGESVTIEFQAFVR